MASQIQNDGADAAPDRLTPADVADLNMGGTKDPKDFNRTYKAAVERAVSGTALKPFDGDCAPTISAGADDQVVSVVQKDGRPVRERMKNGPDTVIAYDEEGNAHRFRDEKITVLPVDFSKIPEWRLKQMNETAYKLIEKYMKGATPTGGPDGMLSFNDISDIMKDIGKMDDLTEVEKCRLWSEVRNVMQDRKVPVLDADEKREMIDSWKGSSDPWHALITLNDGYHGNRLINMSPQDASRAIQAHENGAEADSMGFFRGLLWRGAKMVYGVNQGDINASEGQLKALRELRRGGTFAHYADEWQKQFVRTDRDRFGSPR